MQTSLLAVAEAINTARNLANLNDLTAPQHSVYGDLAEALTDTLALILGGGGPARDAYDAILNGATVADAIEANGAIRHVRDTTYRGHEIVIGRRGDRFTADVRADAEDGEFIAGFWDLPTERAALDTAQSYIRTLGSATDGTTCALFEEAGSCIHSDHTK